MSMRAMAVGFAVVMTACVSPTYDYVPEIRDISAPPIDELTVATVGENMLMQGKFIDHDGLVVSERVTLGVMGGYHISSGEYRKTGQSGSGEFFIPTGAPGSGTVTKHGVSDEFQALMVKPNGEICAVSVFDGYMCKRSEGVKKTKVQIVSADSFQQTLIYSGKIGDKINIGYREFYADRARPGFNNDVEYDLSESSMIGYKGALIEVIEATNQYIRYRVVRNFNSAQ